MEFAFSNTLQEVIDAERAYDFYWEGKIQCDNEFECPDPDCNAKATCVNIKTTIFERIQPLHFRIYHNDDSHCQFNSKKIREDIGSNISGKEGSVKKIQQNFILNRAKEKEKTIEKVNPTLFSKRTSKATYINKYKKGNYSSNYYSIRPLVQNYFNYKDKSLLMNKTININNFEISYNDFFIQIDGQNFNELPNSPKIYFQNAKLISLKNESIMVAFENKFRWQGNPTSTKVFISSEEVKKSQMWEKKLESFKNMKSSEILFFVFGKPYLKTKEDNSYINFSVDNLDLIEIVKSK